MKKTLLATVLTITIALGMLTEKIEANVFDCSRAKKKRFCRKPQFARRGCLWCDKKCVHHSECDASSKPQCKRLKARNRRQKEICKAQGCNVQKRKCVDLTLAPTGTPSEEPTSFTTFAPTASNCFKVDDARACTSECPCNEFETGCNQDSECYGNLKCVKASRGQFDLKEDVSVCLGGDSIDEPVKETTAPTSAPPFPSLNDVLKDYNILKTLSPAATEGLDDKSLSLIKADPQLFVESLDLYAIRGIDKEDPATRPPALITKVEDVAVGFVNHQCDRTKKLGRMGYCSTLPTCKCGEGEGWCRKNSECMDGLKCQKKRGSYYGLRSNVAVCVRDENQPGVWESSGKFEGE